MRAGRLGGHHAARGMCCTTVVCLSVCLLEDTDDLHPCPSSTSPCVALSRRPINGFIDIFVSLRQTRFELTALRSTFPVGVKPLGGAILESHFRSPELWHQQFLQLKKCRNVTSLGPFIRDEVGFWMLIVYRKRKENRRLF